MKPKEKIVEILDAKVVQKSPEATAEWRLLELENTHGEVRQEWRPFLLGPDGRVVSEPKWMPLPGSQSLFLQCPVFETLYEGNRGPGKTLSLLMDYGSGVGQGYGSAWRGILFRRFFGDLDDVVRKIEEWFPVLFPGFRFLRSKSEYAAVFPEGETLLLRHLRDETEYPSFHGHEYPWQGFEELTEWEDDKAYKLMFSCCRPPKAGVPCRIRSTANPYGPGHNWVKKRFQLPEKSGQIIKTPGQEDRVAIRGSIAENFLLLTSEPNYPKRIRQAAKNPQQAKAWLAGDWNVTAGGMFDDLWSPKHHVVPNINAVEIPRGWRVDRAYDHGQSHPFSVGWWLESNGEPIQIGDRVIGGIRGDLILMAEWYGSTGAANEGVRMSAKDIARGILDREEDLGIQHRVEPGPADTEIFNASVDRDSKSPADDMAEVGVLWERANKSPGSRKRGWEMIRTKLKNALPNDDGSREEPGIFVCERCEWWKDLVPTTPRDSKDPDEIPEKYEDHANDMTRYRVVYDPPTASRRSF